jgi:putative ABC transport system permease protein
MSVRSNKVIRDLIGNRARTILVIAALAIGLIGLSTTLRARAIFTDNLKTELASVNAASATLHMVGAGDREVAVVAGRPDVAESVGRTVTFGRIGVGDEVRPLRLVVYDDLSTNSIDRLRPGQGAWPPPTGSIAIERSSLAAAQLAIGDLAMVTDPLGTDHLLPVAATTYDLTVVSGELVDQVIFGYVSFATWQSMGLPREFNQIAFTVGGDRLDQDHIRDAAEGAEIALSARGQPVQRVTIEPPGKHILDNVVSSLLLILGSLGVLSLLLSGFLVFNTVSAMLARQRPQIGVMKAIGASRRDVMGLYLSTIVVLAVLALVIALPIGWLCARVLTSQLGTLLNINIDRFSAPAWVWAVEIGVGLIVPMLAALVPILAGTRVTVAEAIRSSSSTAFGASPIDRALTRLTGLPMSLRYASRNTFRRKARLVLTVMALSIAGAIVVTVMTLQSSLVATIDDVAAYWKQDVSVDLQQLSPAPAVVDPIQELTDVDDVEAWLTLPGSILERDGRPGTSQTLVFGLPADSRFVEPTLTDGRWLEPSDQMKVVINVDVASEEPDLKVGDDLMVRVAAIDTSWEIVGISTTQLVAPGEPRPSAPIVYVPYSELTTAIDAAGTVNRLLVAGVSSTSTAQVRLADSIEAELDSLDISVQAIETRSRTREQVERLTEPILLLLTVMAVLFAVVAGLGLLGTMSLNVLERTTEFGVVRAVGATSRTVLSIVLVEGVSVALLSWVLGSVLALPMGWVMAHQVGVQFIKVPLTFRFAPLGVLLWMIIAVTLAVFASWLPARSASRLSVREAIAYE